MEKPLLSGEGSGLRRPRGPFPGFKHRSDAITSGTPYQKAAALVDLAEDGIGLPEQILDQSNFQSAAKYYFLYFRFSFLWALLYFALIVLNFLEKPLWCYRYTDSVYTCSDRDYFYLGQLPYLNSPESLIYEGITLIVLIVHIFFPISYEGFLYWKNPLTIFKVTCLLILVADMLVYALYVSSVAFDSLPFRIAPYIRVIFFILNFRELRSCMLVLAGMLGTYLNILALGLLFLLFSSWLAYVMFEDTKQGTVFTSYGITLYQMFVLFTTSNNPDVWIPAYKASRWYSLFFVLYVLLGVYFVTNLILAVVYDSFKNQLVKQVSEMDQTRKAILKKAFNLLDKDNVGYLNKDECIQLFEELNKYRTLPKMTREEFQLIFDELDDSGDFKLDIENSTAQEVWQLAEFVFGWVYVLEMALKVYSFGFENYWRDGQNRFDFVVTWIIVIGETITFVAPEGLTFLSNGEWIRYLLIARMLRLIRLLMHIQRYRAFVATFLALIPSLMPYLGTIFCVLCIYCILGVQIFGGMVNDGNTSLEGSELYENDYLLFNFNDYPNGMVTLFNLLVMGNWQAWMESYQELTGTWWSIIYFVSFYLITILLLLNLVVAFVLEAFFAEMDLELSEESEENGKEEEGVKDRRRPLGSKTRSQRIDVLLHHMLSSELTETQPSNGA
ncbi:two pore calcium channel protein 1-like [Pyrus ussuriensis x Pyrus communis]|uniref:Two pore calcium channel protein 1-like n=1 Tax=Pyrus ussuriensis x Pyrus communis TaxID=2448454 RepID=A0A5N5FND5_9ROSA|nr:two pore calcium channel protein 1-like [Pyrus ussuriensis x Pyrus communis]